MVRNAKRASLTAGLIWSGTRSGQALFGQEREAGKPYLTPDLGESAYGQVYLWSGLPNLQAESTNYGKYFRTNYL